MSVTVLITRKTHLRISLIDFFLLYSFFRSRGVAAVSAAGSFNPDKINIFNKACDINGRKLSCFNTNLCFTATFRPNNPVGPIGKRAVQLLLLAYIEFNYM